MAGHARQQHSEGALVKIRVFCAWDSMKHIPEIQRDFSPFLLGAALLFCSDLLVSHPLLNIR